MATALTNYAQSISPVESTEFCPLTDITFNVTLPLVATGTTPTVASWTNSPILVSGVSNLSHTSTQTTFTFVGSFRDVNINQMFKIDYTPNGGTASSYFPQFKRIKSLFYGTCTPIQPSINPISAEICKVVNIPLSFSNLQWKTEFEPLSSACFGSISTYEYLLPTGWSLNGNVSTGAWLPAGNSVIITSDLSTGSGQFVQIRAINSGCGSNLVKGAPIAIAITRPNPPLNITGGAPQLCFPNSYNYILDGVPDGAVVTWPANSYFTISSSGNTATFSPTSAANGSTFITASVYLPACGITVPKSIPVSVGTPYVTFDIVSFPYEEPNCYEVWGIYTFQAQQITGYPGTYSDLQWGWRNLTLGTSYTDPTIYGTQYSFFPYDAGVYEIWTKANNICGTSTLESVKTITVFDVCTGMSKMQQSPIVVYPNPTKGNIKIQIPKAFQANAILNVSNQYGITYITRRLTNSGETIDVDLSSLKNGIYQITLSNGKEILQGKVIKQ